MGKLKQNRKWIIISLFTVVMMIVIIFVVGRSFGFFKYAKESEDTNIIAIKGLDVVIKNPEVESLNLENSYPVDDSEGLTYTPFTFTVTNTSNYALNYTILVENDEVKQDDCVLEGNIICPVLSTDYIRYSYLKNDGSYSEPKTLGDSGDVITNGVIKGNETMTFSLILWVSSEAGNEVMNNYFYGKLLITGSQNTSTAYEETILNGADPVLSDNLLPVIIGDDGVVTKANINEEWYSYRQKKWANAVVLKDTTVTYSNGDVVPENNIESYFVWIPKYSYQLWDLGNYSSLTSIDSTKPHAIPIKFGTDDTSDSKTGECTTPMNDNKTQGLAGESGNCQVGDYMTHPAFLAFDSNGFWVGKFETGYDGASSTAAAQVNSSDASKIIIKPNQYSWRNNTLGNMFQASYNYLRDDDSHMMKNTEWGAVAYLQHSLYCSNTSLRINNNSSYITGYAATEEPTKGYNAGASIEGNRVEGTLVGVDGTYTINYLNNASNNASTTGNYTGIYDMSGGAFEYVMGYTLGGSTVGGQSEITSLHSDFLINKSWEKYYDKYTSTVFRNYNNRILGDATGEIGPFGSQKDPDNNNRNKSSWYGDYAYFVSASTPWFARGGRWLHGSYAGAFAFIDDTGGTTASISFRIVLTP